MKYNKLFKQNSNYVYHAQAFERDYPKLLPHEKEEFDKLCPGLDPLDYTTKFQRLRAYQKEHNINFRAKVNDGTAIDIQRHHDYEDHKKNMSWYNKQRRQNSSN